MFTSTLTEALKRFLAFRTLDLPTPPAGGGDLLHELAKSKRMSAILGMGSVFDLGATVFKHPKLGTLQDDLKALQSDADKLNQDMQTVLNRHRSEVEKALQSLK